MSNNLPLSEPFPYEPLPAEPLLSERSPSEPRFPDVRPFFQQRNNILMGRAAILMPVAFAWFLPKDMNKMLVHPLGSFFSAMINFLPYAVAIHFVLENVGPVTRIALLGLLCASGWYYIQQFHW